jgi:hypothetical protein
LVRIPGGSAHLLSSAPHHLGRPSFPRLASGGNATGLLTPRSARPVRQSGRLGKLSTFVLITTMLALFE